MDFFSMSLTDIDQKMIESDKLDSIGQDIGIGEIIMVLLDDDTSEAIVGIKAEE